MPLAETFTIVLQGAVDHTDSLGSSGRYGKDDAQVGVIRGCIRPLADDCCVPCVCSG